MVGQVRVEGTDQLGVRDVVRPVDTQRPRGTPQPADRTIRRCRERTQHARAVRQHQLGRGHAREEGDLRVPAVGGERGAVGEFVRAVALGDLLLGDVEGDAPAGHFLLFAEEPDVLEEGERFLGGARVELLLDGLVVELGAAADEGAADVGGRGAAVRVQVDRPQDGRGSLVREQARGPLAQHRRVEGDLAVREVEGRDPAVCLRVQETAWYDESRDVGDGVPHAVAVRAAGQVHRLVEVGGRRRVDGEEGDVRRVVRRKRGFAGGPFRLGEHLRPEGLGYVEFGAQCAQRGPQGRLGCAGHTYLAAGHTASVWRGGTGGTP